MLPEDHGRPGLLHIDSAYTLAEARARGKLHYFLGRGASGLFGRTWSVHPVADRAGSVHGAIKVARVGPKDGVVEGQAALCNLPRWLAPLNFLISQLALYRVLVKLVRRKRLAAIVAVDPFLSGLIGLAVARATKRPLLVRISGNHDDIHRDSGALAHPKLFPTIGIQQIVQRFILKRADLVSAINRNNLRYALDNGAKEAVIIPISGQIERVHMLAPRERGSPAAALAAYQLPADRRFLLYFGRLIDLKHPDDALRAMALAIGRVPGTIGMIAGEGAIEPALKQLARELGVADSIRFPGLIDQEQLSLLLPRSVVLSPSAGQMALLESALGEAAIVAYDCDFQSEFVETGKNGFLVERRDWRAMGEWAAELTGNPTLAAELGSNARTGALEQMYPDRVQAAERAAFERLLPGIRPTIGDASS